MLIDTATDAFMQLIYAPALVTFSKFIAIVFDPITIVLASLVIATCLYLRKQKMEGIFFASTILITGIIIKILKGIFQRARPLDSLIRDSGFSFPSGHATIIVVFLGLVIYLFAKKKHKFTVILTSILIILLIGFTRIYLRVHWLTDVVGGFFVGGVILAVSIIIYRNNYFLFK